MSVPTTSRTRNRAIAVVLLVIAAVCAALAVFWMTVNSSFLASHPGHQPKHAAVAAGIAVLSLIAANIFWRQRPA